MKVNLNMTGKLSLLLTVADSCNAMPRVGIEAYPRSSEFGWSVKEQLESTMPLRKLVPFLAVSISVFCEDCNAVAQDSEPENGVVMVELPEGKGRGAGIILPVHSVDSKNEVLILTAYHVVQEFFSKQQRKVPVRFYRAPSPFWAEIVDEWIDTEEDLAVMRVKKQDLPGTIRSLQFGSTDSIGKNSPVMAIGHRVDGGNETWLPDHGLVAQPVGPRITFSRGATDRGFSGGPLLDSNGEVVGMVEEVRGGLGYAKNVNLIRVFLQGLRDKGISLEPVSSLPRQSAKVHVKDGLK